LASLSEAGSTHKVVPFVVDCVSTNSSIDAVSKVVGQGSKVAYLLPIKSNNPDAAPGSDISMEPPVDRLPNGVEAVGVKTVFYQSVCPQYCIFNV
jgi:hypothetical protein